MARQKKRDLQRLGRYIAAARRAHYGTVTAAVSAAGVNTLTWSKAERGEPIREDRLTAIEKALGWNVGDGWIVAEGGEPMTGAQPASSSISLDAVSDEDLIAELRRRLSRASGAPDVAV